MAHPNTTTSVEVTTIQASPSAAAKSQNLLSSAAAFIADGGKLVSSAERQARLAVCKTCEFLIPGKSPECEVCGCKVLLKSHGRAFRCPLGRWPNDPPTPRQVVDLQINQVHKRRQAKQFRQAAQAGESKPEIPPAS